MIAGRATAEGTKRFADRAKAAAGHFRDAAGVVLSSIGLGTYLGDEDAATDEGYEKSIAIAL
ncbi:MAG TPA: aldo/keto reductase, partial [Thermoanaerobaculia bacterium]|nr:aldo/keto reductase [Thermoanaerobaculia bacterium]